MTTRRRAYPRLGWLFATLLACTPTVEDSGLVRVKPRLTMRASPPASAGDAAPSQSFPGVLPHDGLSLSADMAVTTFDGAAITLADHGVGKVLSVLDLRGDDGDAPAQGDIYYKPPAWVEALDRTTQRWLSEHVAAELRVVTVYSEWRAPHALPLASAAHHLRAMDESAALALRLGVQRLPMMLLVDAQGDVIYAHDPTQGIRGFNRRLHQALARATGRPQHCHEASDGASDRG